MRLIDADAFAEEMKKRQDACKEWTQRTIDTADEENYLRSCGAYTVFVETKLLLEKQPTVDAVEVVHGEWLRYGEDGNPNSIDTCIWQCDKCLETYYGRTERIPNYCPNCGAKMDGERRDPCSSQDS